MDGISSGNRDCRKSDATLQTDRGAFEVQNLTFESHDGTCIAYQKVGTGPPIVLANGLGGTFAAWRHLYRRLAPKWTVLCWDYRGLYDSGPPKDPANVTMDHQCRDLERLLEVEGVDEAVFVGWSMGTQVNLEYYRSHPETFRGMVLLNGTYGRPFETAFGVKMMSSIIPMLLRLMDVGAPLVSVAARHTSRVKLLVPALQAAGLVGKSLDMDIFRELAAEFSDLDFSLYAKTLEALGEHDAGDVLSRVECPALMIAGDLDLMTPAKTAREIEQRIPDCRLRVLAGASHYAAVEFPEEVGDMVEGFLEEIGYLGLPEGPGDRRT
jgi:pimeloyl-ACP methyl ester carboxylesterase